MKRQQYSLPFRWMYPRRVCHVFAWRRSIIWDGFQYKYFLFESIDSSGRNFGLRDGAGEYIRVVEKEQNSTLSISVTLSQQPWYRRRKQICMSTEPPPTASAPKSLRQRMFSGINHSGYYGKDQEFHAPKTKWKLHENQKKIRPVHRPFRTPGQEGYRDNIILGHICTTEILKDLCQRALAIMRNFFRGRWGKWWHTSCYSLWDFAIFLYLKISVSLPQRRRMFSITHWNTIDP